MLKNEGILEGGPDIKVVRRVLIVEEIWRSWETVPTTSRFRYDPSMNRVILIGEDIECSDRVTGAHLKESRNFLTGLKLTEGVPYDERQDRLIRIPPREQLISQVRPIIEDINYEDYER